MERVGSYPSEGTLNRVQREKGLDGLAQMVGQHVQGVQHETTHDSRTTKESIVAMRSHLNQAHNTLLRLEREVITG